MKETVFDIYVGPGKTSTPFVLGYRPEMVEVSIIEGNEAHCGGQGADTVSVTISDTGFSLVSDIGSNSAHVRAVAYQL